LLAAGKEDAASVGGKPWEPIYGVPASDGFHLTAIRFHGVQIVVPGA